MRIALAKFSPREVLEVFTLALLLVIPILIIAHPFSTQAQPPNCGDGVVDIDEECDDGNMAPGDGCSDFCTIEEGYFLTTICRHQLVV